MSDKYTGNKDRQLREEADSGKGSACGRTPYRSSRIKSSHVESVFQNKSSAQEAYARNYLRRNS